MIGKCVTIKFIFGLLFKDYVAADKNIISFQIDYQHCHFKFTMNIVIWNIQWNENKNWMEQFLASYFTR
jgi:hypothetical protein